VYAERDRLLRIARSRTLNEAEAEDCVSEAMLRCVEFEGLDEERLGAFLTTVTVRLCADQHRARARLLRTGGRMAGPDAEPGPEENVCERAEAAWLATHLRRLPAHQRRVVEARAAGLSCADVARRFDVSVDAVKSAVARARTSVRAAMASSFGLLPPILGRYRLVAAGVAGVAGVTVGGLLFVSPPEAAPRVPAAPRVALPPRAPAVAVATPVRMGPPAPPAATATWTTAAARVLRPRVASPRAVRPKAEPTTPPIAKAGPYELGEDENQDRYTIDERVMHCVTEGVQLDPYVQCRYPGGDPR
jgi:RNA polymerase sigma factor (sigma-70 family)